MSPKFDSLSALKAGALALAMFAGSAQKSDASIVVFTDFASWSAAAGPFATETFTGNALSVAGLSFTSAAGSIDSDSFNDRVFRGGDTTTWSFGGDIKAFGGNWDLTPGGAGQGLAFSIINAANVSTSVGTAIPNSFDGGFFGFVSTDRFSRVLVAAGPQSGVAETYNVDNLRIGSAVPEPSTWAMMLIGFAGLAFAARRKDRFAAA